MIYNYTFEKNIIKTGDSYSLEIKIPSAHNIFFYKIYGSNGFYNYGKYSSFSNKVFDHKIVISIDKIQNIFINIILKNKCEYYDFINFEKNIKLNIKKKYNNINGNNIDKLIEQNNDKQNIDEDESDDESDEDDPEDESKDKSDDGSIDESEDGSDNGSNDGSDDEKENSEDPKDL